MARQPDQHVRLLGPVDIWTGQIARPVAGTRRKAVLAALALAAGRGVSADRLIDIVWSDEAPATAANTLQSHVSYLRGLFRTRDAIVGARPGYRLELDGDATDLRMAERLLAEAAQAEQPQHRVVALRSALGLWRSRPLADLAGIAWFDGQAARIERLRSDAFTSLIDARLRLGEHAALVPELESLTHQHPFDEALHAQLMLALYRSGRQADAFTVYRELRARLRDELGIDPGRSVRDLEAAMLRQDPEVEPPEVRLVTTAPASGPHVVPAQLPPALPHLVGRDAEVELLNEALEPSEFGPSIFAVSGPPGVGKTALAVAWAHRVAPTFTDGQLYVNLRGFSPQGSTVAAADALHAFLEALGVSPQRIPETLAARVGLYRSVLAGKRVLVVLDNAHDADQARPLLPASPGCVAVVTSRNKLASLVANEGAVAMPIDLLTREAAHGLLAQRLGQKRVVNEPDATDALVSRCGGLPLALAIVAARAATEPGVSLATFADAMRDMTGALDSLSNGDHSTDVRAVISWSYAELSPPAARVFRYLALHPGAEIGVSAVASLAAVPVSQARRLLAEFTRANLLIALDSERYTFHDLIRAYALEQVQQCDTEAERAGALHRLLDHYLHTAQAAAGLLDAYRDAIISTVPIDGVTVARLPDHDQALAWLLTEYPSLLAVIERAATSGFDPHAWQLACTLVEFFERRALWQDWLAALGIALSAAERLGDRRALAYSHRGLGRASHWSQRYDDAHVHHQQALALFVELSDRLGQARTWQSLGRFAEFQGRIDEALSHTQKGLGLFRQIGDRPGMAKALNGVGWYHCLLGDYQKALCCCGEALVLLQELGDRRLEANTWDSLGYAHHMAGDHPRAIDCYQQALVLFREVCDQYNEAEVYLHLGDAYAAAGDEAAARRAWQRSLVIFDELGYPDADQVRARLARS